MTKIHIFGSCAGTEPMPGRHHTAWALETDKGIYWFDAGENCSYTAHLMGLDLLKVQAVFISHTHMDHIGGLGNLFWNIRKLTTIPPEFRQPGHDFELFIPNLSSWDAILQLLCNTEGNFKCKFAINAHQVTDGVLYEQDGVQVEALHNLHLGVSDPWRSFSYRIRVDGKTIIFSGDVKDHSDLAPWLCEGCDLLMIETGHHDPEVIAAALREKNYAIGKLAYVHSGRAILEDRNAAAANIRSVWNGDFIICEDADTFSL